MAQQKTTYTLADILGAPISEQEALNFIRQNTDEDSFRTYNLMDNAYREKLLHFIMGENGLAITYDSVFKHVMMPGGTTERLEHFLSAILGEPVQIKQVLYLKNKKESFTYRDMKPVYLIVFMEKSPAPFRHSGHYIHNRHSSFDTGLNLNLLDNISFISLDTFRSVVQNITTEQDAWLKFLTISDPDEIVEFVNDFPEFLPCYHDLISFRKNPKELITMFSEALRELDRNTEKYMVEQLHNQVVELQGLVAEKDNKLSEKDTKLAETQSMISEKDAIISETQSMLSEKDAKLSETQSILSEKDAMIAEKNKKLQEYIRKYGEL